jgi:hypothetical protein
MITDTATPAPPTLTRSAAPAKRPGQKILTRLRNGPGQSPAGGRGSAALRVLVVDDDGLPIWISAWAMAPFGPGKPASVRWCRT